MKRCVIGEGRKTLTSSREKLFVLLAEEHDVRLEALRDVLEIEELLGELGIKNISIQGSEIYAACPFHNDSKTHWSINVDPDSDRWGLHSCFVCRESGERSSGNVAGLVRDMLQLQYLEALTWLEEFAGVDSSEEALLDLTVKRRLRGSAGAGRGNKGEEDPAALYARMRPLEADSEGWKYLTGRGVSPEQIAARAARRGRDRYQGRVVFPIYSGLSVANFYARSIGKREPKGLYAKKKGTISTTLWGLEKANRLLDLCYLVEGIFDALTGQRLLESHNIPESGNIFATDGPVVHEAQARLLSPFKTVVVVPDMEGNARSLVPTAKKFLHNHKLLIVEPPRGMDLDDWGREDPEEAGKALARPEQLHRTRILTRVNYTIRR